MSDDDLQPLSPSEAMKMWVDRQRSEKAEETLQSYRYRIKQFVEWCEREGIENLNTLDGRDLYRFDSHRRKSDLTVSTLNNQLGTLRLFLDFCEDVEGVEPGLSKQFDVPSLSKEQRANTEKLPAHRANRIGEYLERFRYASLDHVMFALAWETGARLGALHGLDVGDCYLAEEDLERLAHQEDLEAAGLYKTGPYDDDEADITEKISVPFVFFRHRPESDTPLKNQESGERPVSLSEELGELLSDYIHTTRLEAEDEFGRRPLFTSERGGRLTKPAMRRRFNIITQPCRYGTCPHDRDHIECEAREHGKEARCPSARSPHRIRTGAITHHRDCGWPPEVLAEKVNATPETIRDHYDHPELLRRMESRRNYLEDLE